MTSLKHLVLSLSLTFLCQFPSNASTASELDVQYTLQDSLKVVHLLSEAYSLCDKTKETNWMTFFAKKLCGLPYVAKTLEINKQEKLIINLRQVDCTTYVENVIALALCMKHDKRSFDDFCYFLRMVRYKDGDVSYTKRLHYFTQWIDNNTELCYVKEITSCDEPFTAIQKLDINYMSTHTSLYPLLHGDMDAVKDIMKYEKSLTGRQFRYIPKASIHNNKLLRNTIKNGDIIAILTNKKGLDTSHVGIAVWRLDGLHLLNASRLRGQVVLEPKLLRAYMIGQRQQIGIRVIRFL